MCSYGLRDVPPSCLVEYRNMVPVDQLQNDNPAKIPIGHRHQTDFVTWDLDGKAYSTDYYDPRCVVCSANELLPCEAHSGASVRKLELAHVQIDNKDVTILVLVNGCKSLLAGQPFNVDNYGGLQHNGPREAYRWQKGCEDRYRSKTYSLWYDTDKSMWFEHHVQIKPPGEKKKPIPMDPCRYNDGEAVRIRFIDGTTYAVQNHIESLGTCLKSWVLEINPLYVNMKDEMMLDTILQSSKLHECDPGQGTSASVKVAMPEISQGLKRKRGVN